MLPKKTVVMGKLGTSIGMNTNKHYKIKNKKIKIKK